LSSSLEIRAMRRRLMFVPMLLAAAVALSTLAGAPGARAEQKFLVFFHAWSAELDPAAQDVVAAAANLARQNPATRVEVVGFASTVGSQRANLYLSLLRAQLISDRLVEAGIDAARISSVGEGSVSSVDTAQEARRVEIVVRAP
jgi:outer membrane protein OmpA-like peptidoglycan-associated protein